jgi:hypothetical protein
MISGAEAVHLPLRADRRYLNQRQEEQVLVSLPNPAASKHSPANFGFFGQSISPSRILLEITLILLPHFLPTFLVLTFKNVFLKI